MGAAPSDAHDAPTAAGPTARSPTAASGRATTNAVVDCAPALAPGPTHAHNSAAATDRASAATHRLSQQTLGR